MARVRIDCVPEKMSSPILATYNYLKSKKFAEVIVDVIQGQQNLCEAQQMSTETSSALVLLSGLEALWQLDSSAKISRTETILVYIHKSVCG